MTTATTVTRRPLLLNQIVAIVAGVKTRSEQQMTAAYHQIQKGAAFHGLARTYQPKDDEGDRLPPESTLLQVRASDLVADVGTALARMLDVVATQDWANTQARADLVVGGVTLLEDVPVTYLMWLEKEIVRLRAFIDKLPVLDLAEDWDWDDNARAWVSAAAETTKTRKIRRNHVLAEATDRHPAQVESFTEDEIIGYWSTVKFSGALPAADIMKLHRRVDVLVDAIRKAREAANTLEVEDISAGNPIVAYLFGGVATPP